MNILNKKDLNNLTDLEFQVYRYILNNSEKVPYMTIRQLSEEAGISTTTIINFCKKLNCSGFSEFKIRFRLAQAENKGRKIPRDDSLASFFERAAGPDFQNSLDELSQVIHKADNIISVGFGQSGIIAKYAASYFTSLGKFCLCLDSPFINISNPNTQNSIVLMFSVHGEYKYSLSSVRSLMLNGYTTAAVTNTDNNTLARLCDYNIAYYIQYNEIIREGAKMDITTQIPAMYIIEQLAKRVYNLSIDD